MRPALPLLLLTCACASASRVTPVAPRPPEPGALLRFVESNPVETPLDHPDIPDAHEVWPRLIADAQHTLEIAQFYVSNEPDSRLEPVIAAIEAAAARGVKVRLLAEKKFYATYPETLDRLAQRKNIQVRRYDVASLMGGILHAKYFVVDAKVLYLGSQNFDWRSLEHIQELGVEVRERSVVGALRDVFHTDWQLAGGAPAQTRALSFTGAFPVTLQADGAPARVTPVFSPRGFLPDEALWDLPRLVALIDSARRSVRVQVLTYHSGSKHGRFGDLEDALVRAAGRGVKVQLLVSEWATRPKALPGLQALAKTRGLEVRALTIPRWSGGDIPFARVAHAKYLAVDGERGWVGTSNWERDYFYESRNAGLILEGGAVASQLERFFDDSWKSVYAGPLPAAPAP